MKRFWALAFIPFLASCAHIDTTTRVERGPLLRSYERPLILDGGFIADVRADWPTLKLTVSQFDVCRSQKVDEYAEEHITEKTSNAAGPTLSMGISLVLASAILFGVSYAVSGAPDVNHIDRVGNYGASTRQYVQLASGITAAVGIPSLIVGLVTKLRTGDEVRTERGEQIASQRDTRCNERPANGPAALTDVRGAQWQMKVVDGALDVDGTRIELVPDHFTFADREVEIDDAGQAILASWSACVAIEKDKARAPGALSETALLARAENLHQCRRTRPEAMADLVRITDEELARRREKGGPAAWAPGQAVTSFEEAVSAYAPVFKLSVGSRDLHVLDTPQAIEGRAVLVEGIIGEGLTENIGVVQIGDREVFLFIPPQHNWSGAFSNGTRVEVVALVAGTQTLGERSLPLLRAVWMRAAY